MEKFILRHVLIVDDYCKWEVVGVETEPDGTVNKMLVQYTCIGITSLRDVEYIEKDTVKCPFCGRYVQFLTLADHLESVRETQRKMKLKEMNDE